MSEQQETSSERRWRESLEAEKKLKDRDIEPTYDWIIMANARRGEEVRGIGPFLVGNATFQQDAEDVARAILDGWVQAGWTLEIFPPGLHGLDDTSWRLVDIEMEQARENPA